MKYFRVHDMIEFAKENWSWDDSQANNWYGPLVEYLQDSLRIKPLELLLDQIINNETFIQSLEHHSSGSGGSSESVEAKNEIADETKNVIGGGKRKTKRRRRRKRQKKRTKKKTRSKRRLKK